ncbi:MAG: hypothetical protein ACYDAN_09650 [Candidatus Limnocylindrales bacterium]
MKPTLGYLGLGLIGMGFPLSQFVIRRFGTAGAIAVEAASVGVLARDIGLAAAGAPRTMRRGAAVLLWLETSAAALASVLGLRLILGAEGRGRALDQRPVGPELARRLALGTMFGMRTMRIHSSLRPDEAPRPEA